MDTEEPRFSKGILLYVSVKAALLAVLISLQLRGDLHSEGFVFSGLFQGVLFIGGVVYGIATLGRKPPRWKRAPVANRRLLLLGIACGVPGGVICGVWAPALLGF